MEPGRTAEEAAWRKISQVAPRGRYEHPVAYKRRTRKRTNFVERVQRRPNGCWVWVGPSLAGKDGVVYPIFYHRHASDHREQKNTTRSAFPWMMREWFPEVVVGHNEQTTTRCGDPLCINPYHRVRRKKSGGRGTGRMDHALILEVYARRLTSTVNVTAAEFGLHNSQVSRIWSGTIWSSVTGHPHLKKARVRMTADTAREIYALRESGQTAADVARKYNVSRPTVSYIWHGRTWAHATQHGLPGEQSA